MQQAQRALVFGPLAYIFVERGDGLHVVAEDQLAILSDRLTQGGDRLLLAVAEIGGQHLQTEIRHPLAQATQGGSEDSGTTVGELVAVDRGEHHVIQIHLRDSIDHPARLVFIQRTWLTGLHRAETAGTGTGVTQQHEGGGASAPALAAIGAARLLTDCRQLVAVNSTGGEAIVASTE